MATITSSRAQTLQETIVEVQPFQSTSERINLIGIEGEQIRISGILEMIIHDDFENEKWENNFYLITGNNRYRLYLDENLQHYEGSTIEIEGTVLGKEISVIGYSAPKIEFDVHETYGDTLGPQETIVLLANFIDDRSEPVDYNYVNSRVFNENYDSINKYVKEVSYNKAWLVGDIYPKNDWYELQHYKADGCTQTFYSILEELIALSDNEVEFTQHARVLIIFPNQIGCPSSAGRKFNVETNDGTFNLTIATLRGVQDLMSGGSIHEYGHLFGLKHGNGWECGAQMVGENCYSAGYRDNLDVMGYHPGKGHFNLLHKEKIDWINESDWILLEENEKGIYRISNMEEPGEYPFGIKLPLNNGLHYTIEFRRPEGYNEILSHYSTSIYDGAILHYDYSLTSGVADTQILDASPHETPDNGVFYDFMDVVLRNGQTFSDPENNIKVTPLSFTNDYLDVCIGELSECIPVNPPLLTETAEKNRVISINPNNPGKEVLIMVKVNDTTDQHSEIRGRYYFATTPETYNDLQTQGDKKTQRYSGKERYNFEVSRLQCVPLSKTWGEEIHISDFEIVPGTTYEIFTGDSRCNSFECLSEPLIIKTSKYGDINNDGNVNFADMAEVANKIKNTPNALSKLFTKLSGNAVNFSENVNQSDLSYIYRAIQTHRTEIDIPNRVCRP